MKYEISDTTRKIPDGNATSASKVIKQNIYICSVNAQSVLSVESIDVRPPLGVVGAHLEAVCEVLAACVCHP